MDHFNCNCRCIMPAAPELEEKIVKTREAIHELAHEGKSLSNFKGGKGMVDLDTYLTIINRPAKTFPDTLVAPVKGLSPVTGVRRAIVLLVDFSDQPATQSRNHYTNMLFSQGSFAGGSMRDYFMEVSYGKLNVQGAVHGWFRAPRPKSYYTDNQHGFGDKPRNVQQLVEDVIDLANPTVNFSGYDNNGNGFLEAVIIIAAGSGGEVTGNKNDIWSHKWGITPKTVDGKKIDRYFMAPEDGRIGVMSHELGHLLLGWPDLYDTDYSSRGTGRWDLMAAGSWNNGGNTPAHPTAWCKVKAGWVTPTLITNDEQNIRIKPYFNNAQVIKLPVGGNASSKEYFLLSNRRLNGFDANLPGAGLLVEHVDDNQSNNSDENHYLVDIEQADGLRHLNKNMNSGDGNDVFPTSSNSAFIGTSNPNSRNYSLGDSTILITNIKREGEDITATVRCGSPGPKWINDVSLTQTYASSHSKNAFVMAAGISGWKKVHEDAPDGVTNVYGTACDALSKNRKVDLFLDDNKVYRIVMK